MIPVTLVSYLLTIHRDHENLPTSVPSAGSSMADASAVVVMLADRPGHRRSRLCWVRVPYCSPSARASQPTPCSPTAWRSGSARPHARTRAVCGRPCRNSRSSRQGRARRPGFSTRATRTARRSARCTGVVPRAACSSCKLKPGLKSEGSTGSTPRQGASGSSPAAHSPPLRELRARQSPRLRSSPARRAGRWRPKAAPRRSAHRSRTAWALFANDQAVRSVEHALACLLAHPSLRPRSWLLLL